jgi:hypothetical protein
MRLYQIKKLLPSKGNNDESEETAYRMGEKYLLDMHLKKD